MTRYVNPKYILYELSKIRKSSNFNYKRAIERNKKKQLKHPPLIDLLEFMNSKNFSEAEKGKVVVEYWEKVAEDPKFEKEFAEQFKMKYNRKA